MGFLPRALRIASLAGVAGLVAFHAWLFAGRLTGGELLEPAVAARWLASAMLVAALEGLRRSGVPLFRGRRALVFWVTVVVLHWTATPMAERGLPVEELLVAAPAVITLAAGAGLALAGWRRQGRLSPLRRFVAPITPREAPAVSRWLLPVVAARPPPA